MSSPAASDEYVIGHTADVNDFYSFDREADRIGQPGQFGVAVKATHKETGELRAIKIVSKLRFASSSRAFHFKQLRAEIRIMQEIEHPNIIKFYEVYEDASDLFIVMELCTGGELFDRIQQTGQYSESEAAQALRQICLGLQYLHQKQIAHCDLKPDNFLFKDASPDAPIRIIDFGMSKFCQRHKYFKSIAGTPYYVAPEVIKGQYNYHADMWSLGVVMFVMLFGFPPFYANPSVHGHRTDRQIFKLVRKGFSAKTKPGYGAFFPEAIHASESAKDLISRLLTRDMAKRYTAEEALDHPWLRGETAPDTPISQKVIQQLAQFQAGNVFKQAVLGHLTSMLNHVEEQELKRVFERLDSDGDGCVTVDELREALVASGGSAEDAKALMASADIDGDGTISYQELLVTAVDRKLRQKEERLYAAFLVLDLNRDGKVSREEIETVLGKDSAEARTMIAAADADGDGYVDYNEFVELWKTQQRQATGFSDALADLDADDAISDAGDAQP